MKTKDIGYCIAPFKDVCFESRIIYPCCWLKNKMPFVVNKVPESFEDIWNGSGYEYQRNKIKNLDYRNCNMEQCQNYISHKDSYFKSKEELKSDHPHIYSYIFEDSSRFLGEPVFMEMSYLNHCDLKCPSCGIRKEKGRKKSELDKYDNIVKQMRNDLESVYIAGIGDPFFSKRYFDFLCNLNSNDYPKLEAITIQTHGNGAVKEKLEQIEHLFRDFHVGFTISIDGINDKIYSKTRKGGNLSKLKENLEFIKSYKEKYDIESQMSVVVQKCNFRQIEEMIDFAEYYNFDKLFLIRMMNWNGYGKREFIKLDVADPRNKEHFELVDILRRVESYNGKLNIENNLGIDL